MLLIRRKLLQSKAIAIENDLRGTLRNFGLQVVGRARFEARIHELPRLGVGSGRRRTWPFDGTLVIRGICYVTLDASE
jgi:hypothetical protein